MNLIERYLGKTLVIHTLIVIFVLLIILGFSEFMIQMGKLTEEYTLTKGILYTLLKLPVFGYEMFPIAILIGALLGLGGLANHSELTILRVTGWSIRRIFWALMKTVFVFWIIVAIIGETFAPKAEGYAKKIRGEALNINFSIDNQQSLWLREENRYIHIGKIISADKLLNISIYNIENNKLNYTIHANSAVFEADQWLLMGVTTSKLGWQEQQIQAFSQHKWQGLTYQVNQQNSQIITLPLDPSMLKNLNLDTRYMGIVDLYNHIIFLEQNDLNADTFRLEFWRKIATPLVIFGMIALVFPLVFGSQRQVNIGQRVFIGIIIGMGFHLLNQIFGNLSLVYNLSPIIGAFLPSLILISIALFLMKRLR